MSKSCQRLNCFRHRDGRTDGRSVICKDFVRTQMRRHKARHRSIAQDGEVGGKKNSKGTTT